VGSYTNTKKKRRGEERKYISFAEHCFEDFDKILEKEKRYGEEDKKFPGKYPKSIFPEHDMGGETKSFEVFEATPEQIINETVFWAPEVKFTFVPITESPKFWIAYQKSR